MPRRSGRGHVTTSDGILTQPQFRGQLHYVRHWLYVTWSISTEQKSCIQRERHFVRIKSVELPSHRFFVAFDDLLKGRREVNVLTIHLCQQSISKPAVASDRERKSGADPLDFSSA